MKKSAIISISVVSAVVLLALAIAVYMTFVMGGCVVLNRLFPNRAEKIDGYTVMETVGGYEIRNYNGLGGDVVIPPVINGKNVVSIDGLYRGSVFGNCRELTSVTIPDTVTNIGHFAFKDCSNLTSVAIPDSVTVIEYNAFSGCISLTSVTIPDSVITINSKAFNGCENIQAAYKGKTYDYEHIKDLYKAINGS